MQIKFVMLMLGISYGAIPYTHAAQLQAHTPASVTQEVSIIKNVAASIKGEQVADLSKPVSLDALIRAEQKKHSLTSNKESRVLVNINNTQYPLVSRSKFRNFIQSLFGG